MSVKKSNLAAKLRYSLPRIRLCLVHEQNENVVTYAIKSPLEAEKFLSPLRHEPEEHFISLHLNSRHEIIGLHEVSHGTLSASLVHPREVFKAAILSNSHAILVCHNHPSGSSIFPSCEDIKTTEILLKAGRLLGVDVLDHLIVSPTESAYSLRERHPQLWGQ